MSTSEGHEREAAPGWLAPLRTLLANAPLILFAVDRHGVFTASEGAGLRVLGRKSGETVGRSVFEVYKDFAWVVDSMKRVLAGEALKSLGEVGGAWWEVHLQPVRDETGGVAGAVGLATDVTERMRAEEQMLETEERFRKLAEATFEAIAIHEHGKILLANEACAKLFRYEPRELIGKSVLELAAPESRERITEHVATGYEGVYEAMGLCKDGTRFVAELRARMIKYRGRPVRVTAVRDLTALKRAEAAQREVEQLRLRLLSTAAQQLDSVVSATQAAPAVPEAGAAERAPPVITDGSSKLPPEHVNKLREIASIIQRALSVAPAASRDENAF